MHEEHLGGPPQAPGRRRAPRSAHVPLRLSLGETRALTVGTRLETGAIVVALSQAVDPR